MAGTSGAPLLSALAHRVHVGPGARRHVLAGEGGDLGDPQPGLDGQGEHGMVAAAGPGPLVAGAEQGVHLVLGEVGDEVALGPLGRDGQDALDRSRVLGMVEGEVAEQRVDGGQAVVAGGGAVVAVVLSRDRRSALGRRDYAVIMTLLRLGLRAAEVAGLRPRVGITRRSA